MGHDPVDRFIKAGLDAARLKPARTAEPEVLLRRLSFVLTGLPPTAELRDRFLTKRSRDEQKAYEKLVDELLASPHFGERFARHWMDVVRYTDTYGYEWDNPAKGSHEYRDYLIRAFNGDVPYDQFVREQLAGDLLPEPRINAELGINESLIGPMFYHMGEHRHGSSLAFNGVHQDMVNNKIEAFSKAFLATTVACARCHDHKLEAGLAARLLRPGRGVHDAALDLRAWSMPPARTTPPSGNDSSALSPRRWPPGARWPKSRKAWPNSEWPAAVGAPRRTARRRRSRMLLPAVAAEGARKATSSSSGRNWRPSGGRSAPSAASTTQGVHRPRGLRQAGLPGGWVTEGDGIRFRLRGGRRRRWSRWRATPSFARLLPRGYHTHALSVEVARRGADAAGHACRGSASA